MKSTKTIFVVALAALMLFAFSACQQIPKAVSSVTYLEGPTEYVVGSEFNPAAYKLQVNYIDGSSAEVSGATSVKLAQGNDLDSEGAKTVDITYGGVEGQSFVVNVYNGKLELTVPAGVSVTQDVKDGSTWQKIAAIEGIEVGLVYGPSNSKIVLEADQYSLGANTTKDTSTITENDTVSVTVTNNSGLGGENAKAATFVAQLLPWVDPEAGKDTTVDHYIAKVAGDGWYESAVTVTLQGVNAAGDELDGKTLTEGYYILDSTGTKVDRFAAKFGADPVTYTVRTEGTPYQDIPVEIPAGKNFISNDIEDLNVVVADAAKVWNVGDGIAASDFKIEDTITYAIPDTTSAEGEYVNFTISEVGKIKLVAGDNTIHYQIQYCIKGVEEETDVKTLNINVGSTTAPESPEGGDESLGG